MRLLLIIIVILLLVGALPDVAVQFRLGVLPQWRSGPRSAHLDHPLSAWRHIAPSRRSTAEGRGGAEHRSTIQEIVIAKKILATLLMLLALGTLTTVVTGCNTVAGAGTDIERGGEAIHDSARDTQRKM
jgi:entericidin B